MSTPGPVPRKRPANAPNLTPERRTEALAKITQIRRARAELKEDIKHGRASLDAILAASQTEEIGKMLC